MPYVLKQHRKYKKKKNLTAKKTYKIFYFWLKHKKRFETSTIYF